MRDKMQSGLPSILVVDDEPRAVELLARTLRKHARVETAASGDEAWEVFSRGDFALVISDQRMPGMSGVDLLGRIAERDESVGRILLTGYSDLEATVAAINCGRVHAYLHKPCSPPDLQSTVKGVLDRVDLARRNQALLDQLRDRNHDLEQARDRLLASERLAAIGKMIAMVTHDLRSPITVIASLGRELATVAEEGGDGEIARLSLELEREVKGMQRMCEGLLDVARASEGGCERTPEDLDGVVASALAFLAESASNQGVRLEMQLESGLEVPLDEDRLRRALRNLANNSLEAMPEGGTLRVETLSDPSGDRAMIRVADTGSGVPDEIAESLFDPFVSSGKAGGTGLGLSVVRKVMDDHEGSVEVSKPDGGGAAFILRLPLGSDP